MSSPLTVSDLKSRIPSGVIGVCPDTDPRFLRWLNEAEERLLNQGRWWGSIREAQFCVSKGCLVWPREVADIEQIAVCAWPIPIVNQWYPYTRNLARVESCDSCTTCGCSATTCSRGHLQARDKGFAPTFATTPNALCRIRTYPGDLSDVGKKVTYLGYDRNNIWVRTAPGGIWQDGETVTLASPFVDTTTIWWPGQPSAVLRDATNQSSRVFAYDTVAATETALAVYEPDETRPSYRVSFIPKFSTVNCGSTCTVDADGNPISTVTAIVKLNHVPLVNDTDFCIFQNLAAYKEAMLAVRDWENGDVAGGNFHFFGTQVGPRTNRSAIATVSRAGAIPLLVAELRTMTGDRCEVMVHLDESRSFQNALCGFR